MPADSYADPIERRLRGSDSRGAPARGSSALTAILPNGRSVWLRAEPPIAPASAVTRLADLAEGSARRRRAEARLQRAVLDQVSRTGAADATRLSDSQIAHARAVRQRVLKSHRDLDRRLTKAREAYLARIDRQVKIERETVKRLRRRDLWDQIILATAGAIFAAYGDRQNPLGSNNLAITIALLMWLVGDDIVDAIFGAQDKSSPYPVNDTDAWSYLAPIGFVLTAWWLMHERQHERFVAGSAPIPATSFTATSDNVLITHRSAVKIDLEGVVAPGHFPDFFGFTNVPAVATVATLRLTADGTATNARVGSIAVEVSSGELQIAVSVVADDQRVDKVADPIPKVVDDIDVAWIVDTAKPVPTVT